MALKLTPSERKKISHLAVEQSIIVPSTTKTGRKVSDAQFKKRVSEVKGYLQKNYGGYTSVQGMGGYYSKSKKRVIKEKVAKVTGFATQKDFKKNKPKLVKKIKSWGGKWGQESVGFVHEGDMYYFKSQGKKK